jgi:hypothetical protein
VLSITPRIVRGPKVVDSRYREVFSGTEASIRETPLRLDPVGSVRGAGAAVPLVAPGAARAAPPGAPTEGAPGAAAPAPGGANAPAAAPAPSPAASTSVGSITGGTPSGGTGAPPASTPSPTPRGATPPPPTPVDPSTLPPSIRPGGIYKPSPPPQPGSTPRPPQPPPPDESADAGGAAPALAAATGIASAASAKGTNKDAATAAGTEADDTAPAVVAAARPARTLELTWRGPYRVKVGETFAVSLDARAGDSLQRFPLVVRFDPAVLTFLDATLGEFASKSGVPALDPAVDATTGQVSVELAAAAGRTFNGEGALLSLRFKARAPRPQTQVSLAPIELRTAAGAPDVVRTSPITVRVGS